MAKITLGPIVQSVRGSIGGITFRKIGARFYATQKSPGPVSPGRHSGEQKTILKQTTSAWLSLAPAIKQFWERYHALALPRNPRTGQTLPTPYALFLCYQNMRLHTGADMLLNSVPDPPIFTVAEVYWNGPFVMPTAHVQGTINLTRAGSVILDSIALFAATSRTGASPSRFVRKIFPTPEYGPGYSVVDSNWLIYQKLGYPPGLTGLTEQSAPDAPLYMLSGWGLDNDLIWYAPWALPVERGTVFKWPVSLPQVNI